VSFYSVNFILECHIGKRGMEADGSFLLWYC